jgi:hypothetical protein
MGKINSLVRISGTVSGVTFAQTQFGNLIKTKSSLKKEKIMTDPNFVRTRENMEEFGQAGLAGKLLRDTLGLFSNKYHDKILSARFLKLNLAITKLDTTSARGKRLFSIGIQTVAGKAMLNGFEFNESAKLGSVLKQPYVLDTVTGNITIAQLNPTNGISWPKGGDTVTFKGCWAKVDFDNMVYNTSYATPVSASITAKPLDIQLKPASVPAGPNTAININAISIQFGQTVNGVVYSLNNGGFDVLTIIGVE